MAPMPLPAGFDEPWEPKSGFTLIPNGIYNASVFSAELLNKNNADYYKITFRIDGGDYDGEDVVLNYAGLQPKTIFRTYDILEAGGRLEHFYDAEMKKWKGLPASRDLEGIQLQVQVENEPFVSKKDGKVQYNDDGTIRVLDSARPQRFAKRGDADFKFRPTVKPLDLSQYGQGAPSVGGAPSVPPMPTGGTTGNAAEVPW